MDDRRVVHVVRSDSFAGVERYVCDTVTALSRRGWDVTVVGGRPELMRQALPREVGFVPARTLLEVTRAIWDAGPIPVLHTHMTAAEAAAAPLKGIRFDRWVTTRHFAQPRGRSRLGRAASPLIRTRVDVQIAISEYVASAIDGPSVVIHNGVPTSIQPERQREKTVVMMQRLEIEKDTATGLRAWAAAGLAADGWRLQIFGRGAEAERLEQLAESLGVSGSVSFEGFTAEPRRVLAEAGVLLAPCAIDGFGLTVVEAMAEGVPVVGADGGAHRETLGETAVLFTPGDVTGAAAAITRMANDADERGRIGAALRRRHSDLFGPDSHAAKLETVYLR